MGRSDGAVVTAHWVYPLDDPFSSPFVTIPIDGQRDLINVVLLADGYTDGELHDFRDKCLEFVLWVVKRPWFDTLGQAIGFTAISVRSDDSGLDDLRADPQVLRRTFFDARIGEWYSQDEDWIEFDSSLAREICSERAPDWSAAVVLSNSDMGRANARLSDKTAVVAVRKEGWKETILHELGHALVGLGDEYAHFLGCDEDTDRDERPWWWLEPDRPNLTTVTRRDEVKWQHQILPGVPTVPTGSNDDCARCPDYPNILESIDDVPNDSIGLFEGASGYHCGAYRPAYRCRMRNSSNDFCLVCLEAFHAEVRHFLPAAALVSTEPKQLERLQACVNASDSAVLRFRVGNLGNTITQARLQASHGAIMLSPAGVVALVPGRVVDCTARLAVQTSTVPRTDATIEVVEEGTGSILAPAIPLAVEVCLPVARPEPMLGELGFGRIARGHTTYRKLTASNNWTCCSADLEPTFHVPSPPFRFVDGTVTTTTLPPAPRSPDEGDRPEASVWIQLTADAAVPLGPVNGSIDVTFTQQPGSVRTVALAAEVVEPPPVDSVLVMDRSSSMSALADPDGPADGPRRLDFALEAADLYVGLLRSGDRVGLVRYNQTASRANGDVLAEMALAGPPGTGAGRAAIREVLTDDAAHLAPFGTTGIGRGVRLGSAVLEDGTAERRALVVLTDGLGNEPPPVAEAAEVASQLDPSQRVYALALTVGELSEELATLRNLQRVDADGSAAGPLGEAFATGPLVGDREFVLHKLYIQILADEMGQAFVYDPVEELAPGTKRSSDIYVGEVDLGADFIVTSHPTAVFPKYMKLWLETPGGTLIDPHGVAAGIGDVVSMVSEGYGWQAYRCGFPTIAGETPIGRWRVWVENVADSTFLRYSLMCTARSDFRLGGRLRQASASVGIPMDVTLEPSLFDAPVRLDEPVYVRVERPDGHSVLLQLAAQDDGTYQGRFFDTALVGAYHVAAEVSARTPAAGVTVTRVRYLTGFVAGAKTSLAKPRAGEAGAWTRWLRLAWRQVVKTLLRGGARVS